MRVSRVLTLLSFALAFVVSPALSQLRLTPNQQTPSFNDALKSNDDEARKARDILSLVPFASKGVDLVVSAYCKGKTETVCRPYKDELSACPFLITGLNRVFLALHYYRNQGMPPGRAADKVLADELKTKSALPTRVITTAAQISADREIDFTWDLFSACMNDAQKDATEAALQKPASTSDVDVKIKQARNILELYPMAQQATGLAISTFCAKNAPIACGLYKGNVVGCPGRIMELNTIFMSLHLFRSHGLTPGQAVQQIITGDVAIGYPSRLDLIAAASRVPPEKETVFSWNDFAACLLNAAE